MNLKERMSGRLPEECLALLSNRIHIIGNVAIIRLSPYLEPYKKEIGQAVLSSGRSIHTVLNKSSNLQGERRVARYEFLAGRGDTVTIHREFGFSYRLDLSRVFFSSRLGYERMRVAEQVRAGEDILLPFAGVGPFAVPLAARGARVLAVEKSRQACLYLADNIRRNRVEDLVSIINGDAFSMTRFIRSRFSRAVIPAPYGAEEILDAVLPLVKPGGMMHLYAFKKEHEIELLEKRYREMGLKVLLCRRCGNVASGVSRWVFDLARE
jgi:tRNA (guanine37-N1)-methyltransferase